MARAVLRRVQEAKLARHREALAGTDADSSLCFLQLAQQANHTLQAIQDPAMAARDAAQHHLLTDAALQASARLERAHGSRTPKDLVAEVTRAQELQEAQDGSGHDSFTSKIMEEMLTALRRTVENASGADHLFTQEALLIYFDEREDALDNILLAAFSREEMAAMRAARKRGSATVASGQARIGAAGGEMKELNDKIRELTDMLEDRKNAAKLLNTENMRLKKMCQDLQFQLLNKPQSRGESTAVKSMREMAKGFANREQMTAAEKAQLQEEFDAQIEYSRNLEMELDSVMEAALKRQRAEMEADAHLGKQTATSELTAKAGSARVRSRRASRTGSVAEGPGGVAAAANGPAPEALSELGRSGEIGAEASAGTVGSAAAPAASVAGSAASNKPVSAGAGDGAALADKGAAGSQLGHGPGKSLAGEASAGDVAEDLQQEPGAALSAAGSRLARSVAGERSGDLPAGSDAAKAGPREAAAGSAAPSAKPSRAASHAGEHAPDEASAKSAGAGGEAGGEADAGATSPRSARSAAPAAAKAAAPAAAAPAAKPVVEIPPPPPPAAPATPSGNILELLLHDATISPGVLGLPAADMWAQLRLACPGLAPSPVTHVALAAPAPTGAAPLPLRTAHRIHYLDDRRLLSELAAGSAKVSLHNLKTALVGAFACPRLRVLVVAVRDEADCPALELFCMDDEGIPTQPFQAFSSPWKAQLPEGVAPPQPHEFCIDTHRLHRLQADAGRASGLFDTAARVFIGAADGHTYQVWRLADVDARRRGSFRALSRVLWEPAADPWAGSVPLASAALPLTAALHSPPLSRLELSNMRLLLGKQPVVRLYEPSEQIATRTLACRTRDAGEKLVASVRVTARLARDPEVSEQLLGALQPALAGGGAASLPPLHWQSLLGAEELSLARLVTELHAVSLKERQLGEGLAAAAAVVEAAATANPAEAPLARARLAGIRGHVAAALAAVVAFFRQRLELYRLGAAAWHFITAAAGPDDPVARLPAQLAAHLGLQLELQAAAAAAAALAGPAGAAGASTPAAFRAAAQLATSLGAVMGREVDRVLDSVKGTLDAVRANRSLDAETLAACLPPLATALTSHAAAAVTACFWLATQLLLTPVLVTTHAPPLPLLLQSEATAAPGGGSSGSGSGSSSGGLGGSCYSASLHVASGLAADPAAVLSEAKLAARIAAEADVVVLSGRLTDAGSMVKWLAQQGVLVLAAPDLSPPAAGGGRAGTGGGTRRRRAGGAGPLAALTYLTDVSLAKPVLATAGELGHRLTLSLQALEATFAAAPLLAPHAEMLARHQLQPPFNSQQQQQQLQPAGSFDAYQLEQMQHVLDMVDGEDCNSLELLGNLGNLFDEEQQQQHPTYSYGDYEETELEPEADGLHELHASDAAAAAAAGYPPLRHRHLHALRRSGAATGPLYRTLSAPLAGPTIAGVDWQQRPPVMASAAPYMTAQPRRAVQPQWRLHQQLGHPSGHPAPWAAPPPNAAAFATASAAAAGPESDEEAPPQPRVHYLLSPAPRPASSSAEFEPAAQDVAAAAASPPLPHKQGASRARSGPSGVVSYPVAPPPLRAVEAAGYQTAQHLQYQPHWPQQLPLRLRQPPPPMSMPLPTAVTAAEQEPPPYDYTYPQGTASAVATADDGAATAAAVAYPPQRRWILVAGLPAIDAIERFRPITVERPKALLPLVNVPMIEYALEWLAMNDVEEAFVFCCAHADLIKRYLADSKWAHSRDMKVRCDLMDTHICVCAPEVLLLFSDNFDYQNIKRDFVSGVLSEEELGNKLHVYELRQAEYAGRVHNLRSYDAVSRDLLQRWAFPFVPDTNVLSLGGSPAWGQTSYRYSRGQRYMESTVSLARSTVPGEDVCIGAGTSIGEGSRVVQSVVGRNVRIGRNVDIVGAYIQDGVTIQDGVVVRSALVCEGCVLRAGCVVGPGAILSYGCVVDSRHSVPPNTRISLCLQVAGANDDSDDELEYSPAANVVIELNGLKIAEDRTFADCARYMLTALLNLGLPPPPRTPAEYLPLFKTVAPEASKEGQLALLRGFKQALADWRDLLQRFLKSEDDQVELLLTLEEYCSCEGVFEADGGGGARYAPLFAHLLRQLYDCDVVGEDALLAWADEKAAADAEERRHFDLWCCLDLSTSGRAVVHVHSQPPPPRLPQHHDQQRPQLTSEATGLPLLTPQQLRDFLDATRLLLEPGARSSSGGGGTSLTAARHSCYDEVIRAADAAGLYDISGVQHYTDHGHKVVFLHARPQKSKPGAVSECGHCHRSLMDAGSRHCSLECKLNWQQRAPPLTQEQAAAAARATYGRRRARLDAAGAGSVEPGRQQEAGAADGAAFASLLAAAQQECRPQQGQQGSPPQRLATGQDDVVMMHVVTETALLQVLLAVELRVQMMVQPATNNAAAASSPFGCFGGGKAASLGAPPAPLPQSSRRASPTATHDAGASGGGDMHGAGGVRAAAAAVHVQHVRHTGVKRRGRCCHGNGGRLQLQPVARGMPEPDPKPPFLFSGEQTYQPHAGVSKEAW
eukprot:XP_001690790.1 predicted protein [Chlamydomonas reinhardtii]